MGRRFIKTPILDRLAKALWYRQMYTTSISTEKAQRDARQSASAESASAA